MELTEYAELDATDLAAKVRGGEVTSGELAGLAIAAAAKVEPSINSIVEVYDEPSTRSVSEGLLLGVPTLRKDTFPEAGRLCEQGSRLAQGMRPPVNAHVIDRLLEEGASVIGRSAVPEMAILSSTESVLHGITRNPWSPDVIAGGSSGGAASAVAAGIVPFATASDGGGSIRIPAACCGIVGLKPSRGLIPVERGHDEYLFGVAVPGVVSRTVRDTALALAALTRHQPGNPFAPWGQPDFSSAPEESIGQLRVAVSAGPWAPREDIDPEVVETTELVARALGSLGHRVRRDRPDYDQEVAVRAGATFFALAVDAEVQHLAAATGRAVSPDFLEPVSLTYARNGQRLTSVDLMDAFEGRARVCWQVEEFFERHDVLVTPTLQILPPVHGTGDIDQEESSALAHWLLLERIHPNLSIFNLTGHPAISLPIGQSRSGIPIGVQIVGRRGADADLVRLAALLERELPWAGRRPPVHVNAR